MMMRMSLFGLVVAGALSAFAWYRPDYGWPIMAALALWTFVGVSIDLTLIRTDLALIRDRLDRLQQIGGWPSGGTG